jgi:hypothetical protein
VRCDHRRVSVDLHVFGRSEKAASAIVDVLRNQMVEERAIPTSRVRGSAIV